MQTHEGVHAAVASFVNSASVAATDSELGSGRNRHSMPNDYKH